MQNDQDERVSVTLPEATDRWCSVCGAEVAAWPKAMVCHCGEMHWERVATSSAAPPPPSAPSEGERLIRAMLAAWVSGQDGNAVLGQYGDAIEAALTPPRAEVPSGEVVDRVAKAICRANWTRPEYADQRWDEDETIRDMMRDHARAAIAALRPPSAAGPDAQAGVSVEEIATVVSANSVLSPRRANMIAHAILALISERSGS